MPYKYETHMHTSQGSDCSSTPGAEMVRRLYDLGYSGCFITDHFFGGNTAVRGELASYDWEVRVRLFCQGYEDAREMGEKLGFKVFFGLEYARSATEFLTYGVTPEFLIDHPETADMPLDRYAALVHDNGGFVVHAHPFREADYIRTIRLFPHAVDGVEIYNCNNRDEYNSRAKWYAESYGIPVTGGSDSHHFWCHPCGGIITEERLESPSDYLRLMREGKLKIAERDHSKDLPEPQNPWAQTVRPSIDRLPKEVYGKFFGGEKR